MNTLKNLIDITNHFADKQSCMEYLANMRWNGTAICPHCTHDKAYTLQGKTKRYKCAGCRKQFSVIKGTIFESSPIPLQKWFVAVYLLTSHKKGISSLQLSRDISVTQKTAWFMLQRIRFALATGTFESIGKNIFEADETYVGGKLSNRNNSRKGRKIKKAKRFFGDKSNKATVIGIVERGGNVTAKVALNDTGKTINTFLRMTLPPKSMLYTDEHNYYKRPPFSINHESVCHYMGEYVRGDVHTNTIEGFWSMLKRGIIGIYHQVSVKHLDKYVDEFEFRYNTKKMAEMQRFEKMLSLSNGKRLTYANLIDYKAWQLRAHGLTPH